MRPIPVEQNRRHQPLSLIMLDDAEMLLELNDLAQNTNIKDQKLPPAPPMRLADISTEFASAACLILDREEAEALEKELAAILQGKVAAA